MGPRISECQVNGRAGLDFSPTYCVLYFRTLCAFIRVLVTARVLAASDRGVSTFSPTGPGPVHFLTNMTHEAKKQKSCCFQHRVHCCEGCHFEFMNRAPTTVPCSFVFTRATLCASCGLEAGSIPHPTIKMSVGLQCRPFPIANRPLRGSVLFCGLARIA